MENELQNKEEQLVKELSHPLYSSKSWIKLVGILLLIYGIFVALTVVGIVIAWLPIWLGILLIQSSNRITEAQLNGDKLAMIKAQSNLGTYFTIYGVLILVGIIMSIVFIILAISAGLMDVMEEGIDYIS